MSSREQNFLNISQNPEKQEEVFVGKEETLPQEEMQPKFTQEEIEAQKEVHQKKIDDLKDEIEKTIAGADGLEAKEKIKLANVMDADLLDKIAKLEAIDPNDLQFSDERYQKYLSDEKNGRHGTYSVTANQKSVQDLFTKIGKMRYSRTQPVYGEGGWNRYIPDAETGMMRLSRGASNTTGSEEYKNHLAKKAQEMGITIG